MDAVPVLSGVRAAPDPAFLGIGLFPTAVAYFENGSGLV
jgi:hypothetical protein